MIGKQTIEEKWRQQSEVARQEAQNLPYGKKREALLRMARQLRTASQLNQWLSSPALKPPEQEGRNRYVAGCWGSKMSQERRRKIPVN